VSVPASPATIERQQFDRDGYLCPVEALSPAQTAHYRALYLDFHARHKQRLDALRAGERWQINTDTHFVFEWVDALTREPGILDAVERVLGPNLLAWNTNWFVKFPGDKAFVSWHQDGAYWGLSPMEVATAWVALGPVTPENGCMRVVPGSHTKTHLPQRDTFADNNVLSRGQEITVAVDEARAVNLALQPGQISLHHLWIVHGSNANQSDEPRIGLAIRYVAPQVRQEGANKPIAMLVRGQDQHGHFTLTERPVGNAAMAGEGRHAELLQRVRVALAQARPADPAPPAVR
jgi:ectoine hydroxylase-related dioxygenase (phytanoyl-CoA dioxygenase family)